MNDLLQMVAAGQVAHILTAHRAGDVPAQQHRRELADLINVVALLPPPHPSPRDLRWRVEHVEGVGGDTLAVALVPGDAKIPELQLLVLAHEHVEGGEVAVQRLAAVQGVEGTKQRRDLASHDALGLRAPMLEPGAHVPVLRVLHHEAVAHAVPVGLGEPIEDSQCARLPLEQLGEVGFAQPGCETRADLDADLRGEAARRRRGREIDLAEAPLPDEAVEPVGATGFGAMGRRDVLLHAKVQVGPLGFEPRLTDPKSAVLPLDEGPVGCGV